MPGDGKRVRLVEAGNHAQGCIFLDGLRLHSDALERRVDEISRKLSEFYIGRYDIRYSSEELLRKGHGFRIVELNGAASGATNIYDARTPLWEAYRTLFRQRELVFEIGVANRARGVRPVSVWALLQAWHESRRRSATHPLAD